MEQTVKYPIGIQNFEKIRKEGFLYIDKTSIVKRLINEGCYYFLSRPRRFGKSLLLSTIHAYFDGKRELFKGLAIDTDEMSWEAHPVMHLDLNTQKYETKERLDYVLNEFLATEESKYGIIAEGDNYGPRFAKLIRVAHEKTGRRVVILVDEYDKPLLQAIGKPELQDEYRSTLKAFYGALKSMDGSIQFALLTGVTKFSKVSVFSDLNNLMDISLDDRYQEICGMTARELRDNLNDEIEKLAVANRMTTEECYAELKRRYDGYHFSEELDAPGMYNPFSILNTMAKRKFQSYWFETGTPDFLVRVIKDCHYRLDNLVKDPVTSDLLGGIDALNTTPLPLLFQSGYLTIKDYSPEFGEYTLDFPNAEVEEGFIQYLSRCYQRTEYGGNPGSQFFIGNFIREIRAGQAESFMHRLDTFLADGDYQIAGEAELYFQNVMYIVFKMLGFHTQVERHTSNGRMDVVMQTSDFIYIFELKLDGSAQEAFDQIESKGYASPFSQDARTIVRIGANFSSETRHFTQWLIG